MGRHLPPTSIYDEPPAESTYSPDGQFLLCVLVVLFIMSICAGIATMAGPASAQKRDVQDTQDSKPSGQLEYSPSFHYFGSSVMFF